MQRKAGKRAKRLLSLLLTLVMCLGMLPGMALAAEPAYTQVTSAEQFTTGQYYMVADTGYAPGAFDGSWLSAVQVTEGTVPENAVWILTVTGDQVTMQAPDGNYAAPKGGNINGIEQDEYSWKWEFNEENSTFSFCGQGDDTVVLASNKSSQNKFRAYKTTTVSGNPSGYPSEFTLYKAETGSQPGGETAVAAPQASPQAGAVASGTQITLTCSTAGASIYYTMEDTVTNIAQDGTLYSEARKPVITEACTLRAVAVKDGVSSAVQTLSYTIQADEPVTESPIADGDQVVIYAPAYNKALSSEKVDASSYYNKGVDVTMAEGVLSGYGSAEVWTVVDNNDGTFSFQQDGQNIGLAEQFASMNLGAEHDDWALIDLGDGLYNIKNTGRGNYMEWYAQFGNWSTYNSGSAATDGQFQLSFYKVTGEIPDEPDEGGLPIKEGDEIGIYLPGEQLVLTTTVSGSRLTGASATLSDSILTTDAANAVFTVSGNNTDGFQFVADGKYLTTGATGNSLTMADTSSDYSLWILEQNGTDGWFIKNKAATYGNNAQYIEYYASTFTTYSKYDDSDPAIYTFQFYQVTDAAQPEPGKAPIAAGDNVVIYAPSNNMALSAAVKNSYYPVGVEVSMEGDTLTGYDTTEIWTVGGDADTGFTFSNGGKTISMAGSFNSMYPGAGSNETWLLESAETDGQYYVKNAGRGTYMFWDDEYDDWTTRSGEKTAVCFYPVTDLPDEPEDPDVTGLEVRATPSSGASVKAGDTIELTAAEGAVIYYTTDGTEPATTSAQYTAPLVLGDGEEQIAAPAAGEELVIKAIAVLPGSTETAEQVGPVCTFTYKAPMTLDGYNLYFGQLHSHTNISDGAGSVEEAFEHASQVDNLDFLAVTDHSNSFDNESDPSVDLGADLTGVSSEWAEGHQAAEDITTDDFVGIYGFEMTWSDGFGHINTFNTPGFESRSNDEFGNKSGSTEGYQNYYDKLVEVESSLSQFNHPGTTFGDFQDFSFYDPQVDQRITLIEVGNGEGAIGSSGYFPSYECYTRALDKGWHVAPTNNQDNHKGSWGDSNTARSVVLADGLTEDAIYDAIRNYRVYATEDNDLSILYELNGNAMGSILQKQEDGVELTAQISDPTDSADMKVEVIVNGGLVIGTQTVSGGTGTVNFDFDSNDYSYYYLRVTQADGNIAVTAPVWTGEGVNAGISKTECDTVLVVKGEEVNLSSELFNNAGSDMTVRSLTYSVDGQPIHTADVSEIGTDGVIASGAAATVSFPYTFTSAGKTTVNVQMTADIGGTEYTFTSVLQLTITDESLVTRVLVDGTHYNDYVNGYYAGNMGNFTELAAGMNAQVKIEPYGEQITAEDLENVALLVISAPLKYDRDGLDANESNRFSDEFITAVADYVKNGGTVIMCGLADYQDGNEAGDNNEYTTYGQINKLLEGIGATVRVNDDELIDQDDNGGQAYRLYFDDFNFGSTDPAVQAALAGLEGSDKVYSSYSGCSVSVGEGEAIVFGHDTTYSINSKAPAQGHDKPVLSYNSAYDENTAVVKKGDVVSLATEAVGSGRVYVGGTVWMSDFEVASDGSNGSDYGDASYANKSIISNILSGLLKEQEISTIAAARANTTVGTVFTVEGTVTAGNVEPNAFYDTIYIQDETGGINIYPVATTDGTFAVGQRVRVTGSWDQYQGDTELRCISIERIDSSLNPIDPEELSLADASNYSANGGLLAKVGGTVKSVIKEGDAISSVILTDGTNDFRLLFNNYIGYSDDSSPDITTFVEEGAEISAVGVIYTDPEGVCLRVRDLSEVTEEQAQQGGGSSGSGSSSGGGSSSNRPQVSATGDGGSVTASNSGTVTITPDEGYRIASITVNGEAVEIPADGKLTGLDRNDKVVVTFEKIPAEQPTPDEEPFTDVADGAWYAEAVQYVYENGMMNGVSATSFGPDMTTNRAMVVTILYRLAGSPDLSDENLGYPFADVDASSWYGDAVYWARLNGITNGTSNTTFGPNGAITREQMAAILYRYASFMGYDVTVDNAALNTYADASQISSYAVTAMQWANETGLITGRSETTLAPQGTATRAEVATILMRFCEDVAK